VGFIIATTDGGRTWAEQHGAGPLLSVNFRDALHGTVKGWDGDSPQHPITLTTSDAISGIGYDTKAVASTDGSGIPWASLVERTTRSAC
jgi:photosystem II stability/assembly factor-like uncharacterized protein